MATGDEQTTHGGTVEFWISEQVVVSALVMTVWVDEKLDSAHDNNLISQ